MPEWRRGTIRSEEGEIGKWLMNGGWRDNLVLLQEERQVGVTYLPSFTSSIKAKPAFFWMEFCHSCNTNINMLLMQLFTTVQNSVAIH